MRMNTLIFVGTISFSLSFLGLLLFSDIGEVFYQRWFYHPTPTWYVPLLLILSLFIASMIGAVFFVASHLNQTDSLFPWLLIFWTPVFVMVMEGINWDNNLVHLIYSFAGERVGLENGWTLGIGLFLSFVFTYIIIKLVAKLPVNFLTAPQNYS